MIFLRGLRQTTEVLFFGFLVLLPLNQFFSTRLLFASLVVGLAAVKRVHLISALRSSWEVFLYLLVLLLGLIYTVDFKNGLQVVETSFPLLALPLLFGRLEVREKAKITSFFKAFNAGLLSACTILSVYAFYQIVFGGETNGLTYEAFTSLLGFQPTYFSYYLVFGITFNLYRYFYDHEAESSVLQLISILVFFCCLLLTSSKTTFVTLVLIMAFFILRFLNEEKTKNKKVATLLCCIILMSIFLIQVAGLFHLGQGDAWDRGRLWSASLQAIPNLFFGAGTGGDRVALISFFNSHDLPEYARQGLNAHNQIIEVLLSNGVLGLLSFLLVLVLPLYRAARGGHMVAVISLFPFVVYGVTEVFLGRYQGVVFFAFLHQSFAYWMSIEQREHTQLVSYKRF
jgi:O-antigen ligase